MLCYDYTFPSIISQRELIISGNSGSHMHCRNVEDMSKFSGNFFFQSDDGGEYKCVASNDAGIAEGVAYLIIRSPLTLKIAPPREVKVKLGREY